MHRTNADFWKEYGALPADPSFPAVQEADRTRGQEIWSARVTLRHRALAVRLEHDYVWFWIGEHETYDAII
jgi:hypothetical protein